jgi:leukotriene A-4 hydrolase/aminopeptidase
VKPLVRTLFAIVFAFSLIMQAQQSKPTATGAESTAPVPVKDEHSFGNPQQIQVTNIDLDLTVDFAKQSLSGTATLALKRNDPSARKLVLDDENLAISKVEAARAGGRFAPAKYTVGEKQGTLGAPLTIDVTPSTRLVRITYETDPTASALQWLKPEQTAGKKHPYLYSQSEAAHGRSWIPMQDSPGVRVTYTAKIHTPKELIAVMSAAGNPQPGQPNAKITPGEFSFQMKTPIPTYLIAIAVGDLAFRPLGPRTGVYDEPSLVDRDAKEFEDVESMVKTVEGLYGPYAWGRYDILVLPPSSPYGGMENPRLTFVSPTVVAGDKSLVSVVSHELAHSWSGNTVTNATWSDFWLNEGFTTYIERRIVEAVYGKDRAEMEADLGRQRLVEMVREFQPNDTVLHIDLSGRDPDEGSTELPYEKGALFLRMLEQTVGREKFDSFLRSYFGRYRFRSITTKDFLDYMQQRLLAPDPQLKKKLPMTMIDEWIYKPGMPASAPEIHAAAFTRVEDATKKYLAGEIKADQLPAKSWSTPEWLHFLKALPRDIGPQKMADLDQQYHLTDSGNIEIAFQWLLLAIKNHYTAADQKLESTLLTVGRRKIVKPLYGELAKTPEGKEKARQIFERAKSGYHPIVVNEVTQMLK